jgi:methylenetetrahydrofolate reductase (NADPH)
MDMSSSDTSLLARRLQQGDFVLTAEIMPPVSARPEDLLKKAEPLRGHVDAVNVTDGASARVHMSSVASAAILAANGIEPIAQFTCRDRNRIALLGDLLGASALGVKNLLLLGGDDPSAGDQPDAKPVFDLKTADLISMAHEMVDPGRIPSAGAVSGDDPGVADRKSLPAPVPFFVGAADMPQAERSDSWANALAGKIAAGARFVQTQLCYDIDMLRGYGQILVAEGFSQQVHVLVGNGPLLSARSAIWMRDNLFGVAMPDAVIKRLEDADDPKAEGINICVEQLQALAEIDGISGVHLMAPINTASIPAAIAAAAIR